MTNDIECDCSPCWTLREKEFWYANCEYQNEDTQENSFAMAWDDEEV